MPREKRDETYTRLLANAIAEHGIPIPDAAAIIGVRVDTINGWLYVSSRAEAPKWAYDLFMHHLKQNPKG